MQRYRSPFNEWQGILTKYTGMECFMSASTRPKIPESEKQGADVHQRRKADHIRINLEEDVSFKKLTNGLERYFFMHQALPELDLAAIDTAVTIFGKTLKSPLLISSMTGGTAAAKKINQTLAAAAQEAGIAMGLGSQRAAIEDESLADTYQCVPLTRSFYTLTRFKKRYNQKGMVISPACCPKLSKSAAIYRCR
jgi:hypothetical protein